jgi:uncharacterized Zn-binding protein involved in type VI secretion
MAAPISVVGDTIGGVPTTNSNSSAVNTLVYGLKPILDGDPLPNHGTHTGVTARANPAQTMLVNGKRVVRVNVDPASCGDVLVPAVSNLQTVIVGP